MDSLNICGINIRPAHACFFIRINTVNDGIFKKNIINIQFHREWPGINISQIKIRSIDADWFIHVRVDA